MQEIKDLKTRDIDILSHTIRKVLNVKRDFHVWDLMTMTNIVKTIPVDTYLIYSNDLGKWVFTDILDDDLVYQEYFGGMNFVIVEHDICMALARGIHYRVHKKLRP